MRRTIFIAVVLVLLFTAMVMAQGEGNIKRYTVYSDNNSHYRSRIDTKKEACVAQDTIQKITYLPDYCVINFVSWKNINLMVPVKGALKLKVGDCVDVICFRCVGLLTVENIPSYLAIKINKVVGYDNSRIPYGALDKFATGSIESITNEHHRESNYRESTVRIIYRGEHITTGYALNKLDKFTTKLQKSVVLRYFISFVGGDEFLVDIYDESVFQKLLNGEFPQK